MEWKYFTAEGMRDKLPADTYARREAEASLRRLFWSWGYEEVETPELEFADVYLYEHFVRQEALYKLSDPRGRLLALRYDNTVPMARLAATSGRNLPLPLRLSYIGTMFRLNDPSGAVRGHQFEQAGVELMGDSSAAADAEIVMLAIKSLLSVGLRDFKIVLNQTAFFKALLEDYTVEEGLASVLPGVIDGKEYVKLDEILSSKDLDPELAAIVEKILETEGSYAVLDALDPLVKTAKARKALADLRELMDYLKEAGLADYVAIDPGLLKNLSYYTGMIFRGYVKGAGAPLLSGGRYDKLCAAFGRDMPATGFSLDLDLLDEALKACGLRPEDRRERRRLCYPRGERSRALAEAEKLRREGIQVCLDEQSEDDFSEIFFEGDGES